MEAKIVFFAAIILVFCWYVWSKFKSYNKDKSKSGEEIFLALREQFFALKPIDLKLDIPLDQELTLGLLMELEIGGGVASIVSLSTGDASLYTSKGGGIIGGSTHQNVRNASLASIATAQKYFPNMEIAVNKNPPGNENIKIFILTSEQIYAFEAPEADIANQDSRWTDLFNSSNEVLTQLRISQ